MNQNSALYKKFELQKELWVDNRFILADVPLNKKRIKRILPAGMWLTGECKATLFIVDYKQPNFTAPYKEAGLLVHIRTLFGKGLHCCWMAVDDDTAMIYGRELLGYPKKMADISYRDLAGQISADVFRRGTRVLKMEGKTGKRQVDPSPVIGCKIFNASGPGQMMYVQPVWLSRPKEVIHESYSADVTIELESSECDPLSYLIEGPAYNGRYVVTDIPGARYVFPVGMTGPLWLKNTYNMRYR